MENKTEILQKGFWNNFIKWKKLRDKKVFWQNDWLKNDFCGECRLCCGPQGDDEPFPMPLLERQIKDDPKDRFYLLSPEIAYIGAEGCKSDTASGCSLSLQEKPVACNLFPIVLINGKLYLYQNCPAALFTPVAEFMETGKKAGEWLMKFKVEELKHLSIKMEDSMLAEKFIDLHIRIFEGDNKFIILE